MSYQAWDGNSSGWSSTGKQWEEDFAKYGNIKSLTPGASYGPYQAIAVNPNNPGWGDYVPKNAEKVYWQGGPERDPIDWSGGPGAKGPGASNDSQGIMLIRKTDSGSTASTPAAPRDPQERENNYARARELSESWTAGNRGGSFAGGGFKPIDVSGGQNTYNSISDMANTYLGRADDYRTSNRFLTQLGNEEMGAGLIEGIESMPKDLKLAQVMTPDQILEYAKKSASAFGLA